MVDYIKKESIERYLKEGGLFVLEYGGSPRQLFVYHYTQERLEIGNKVIPEMDFFTGTLKKHEHTIARCTIEKHLREKLEEKLLNNTKVYK